MKYAFLAFVSTIIALIFIFRAKSKSPEEESQTVALTQPVQVDSQQASANNLPVYRSWIIKGGRFYLFLVDGTVIDRRNDSYVTFWRYYIEVDGQRYYPSVQNAITDQQEEDERKIVSLKPKQNRVADPGKPSRKPSGRTAAAPDHAAVGNYLSGL